MKNEIKLKVTPNRNNRTFTIRKYLNGKIFAKYRTYQMTQKEFELSELDTLRDWQCFLIQTNDYYKVN